MRCLKEASQKLLAPFKMSDLCSEKSTSKALSQFSPRTRSFSCSWLQLAILVPGNSFTANSPYTSRFRNLHIIADTSDTHSECDVFINGSYLGKNTRNWLNISATVNISNKVNLAQNVFTSDLITDLFVCFIMQNGRFFCRDIDGEVLLKII